MAVPDDPGGRQCWVRKTQYGLCYTLLSSRDIVGTIGPWGGQAFRGGNHVITPSLTILDNSTPNEDGGFYLRLWDTLNL